MEKTTTPNEISPDIRTESEYIAVRATLSRQNRPAKLLKLLMNAFEGYRQARKIGWSRPWNKAGMRTFLAFRLDRERDADLLTRAAAVLADELTTASTQVHDFCAQLLADPQLMIFAFFSEYEEKGISYESMTLSLGRIHAQARRHRDRADLVFDAQVHNQQTQGLTRLRFFVDPYEKGREPLLTTAVQHPLRESSHRLFLELAQLAREHGSDPNYIWDHWTSNYIDYFGPRRWHLEQSIFGSLRQDGASKAVQKAA
jgi:hypothetical protein